MPPSQAYWLRTLAATEPEALKAFAENLLPDLDEIDVLKNRTGLVMLPMRDTAQGTAFHLGEVLMSEAHIRRGDAEGFGMRHGRDLEAAMAMAVVDLAMSVGIARARCESFVQAQAAAQRAKEDDILRRVEATRVDMETF